MFNLIIVILSIALTIGLAIATLNYVSVERALDSADARIVANGLRNFAEAGRFIAETNPVLPTSIADIVSTTGITVPPIPKDGDWVVTQDSVAGVVRVCATFPFMEDEIVGILDEIATRFSPDAIVPASMCDVRPGQAAIGVIILPARH